MTVLGTTLIMWNNQNCYHIKSNISSSPAEVFLNVTVTSVLVSFSNNDVISVFLYDLAQFIYIEIANKWPAGVCYF